MQKFLDKEYHSQFSSEFKDSLEILRKPAFNVCQLQKEEFFIKHRLSLPSSNEDILLFDMKSSFGNEVSVLNKGEQNLPFISCKITKRNRSSLKTDIGKSTHGCYQIRWSSKTDVQLFTSYSE